MNRRGFITVLGGAATWPLAVRAQQSAPTVGILESGNLDEQMAAFVQRLRQLGWTDGRNIVFEFRRADGRIERFAEIADDFARRKVDAIFTYGTPATLAAKQATSTIPIVSALLGQPVEAGLVASFARPGGNVTGLTTGSSDVVGKRIEFLLEMIPALRRLAIIGDGGNPTSVLEMHEARAIAQKIGLNIDVLEIRRAEDIAPMFERLDARIGALYVCPSALIVVNAVRLFTFAAAARLPTICGARFYLARGGLVSYATNFTDLFRRAADYLDKVLRGTKPADLPIEQPTRYELIFNLATARAIRFMVPNTLLVRADELIE
jgi:putative tryptophan/tyrosine transport system substrate-binding protein